jgi:hypothetical protein
VLDALIRKRRDHHFRAGHFRHDLLRFLTSLRILVVVTYCLREIKKGLKSPCFSRTANSRGWIYPPPAVRLRTRTSDETTKCRTRCALPSQTAFYKHCGKTGQANCGRNPARRLPVHFKHAFEIGLAREKAAVNFFSNATARPRFCAGAARNPPRRFALCEGLGAARKLAGTPIAPPEGSWPPLSRLQEI